MPVIKKSATIQAPVEQVFDTVDDPERVTEYAPGVSKVSDVQRSEQRVGDTFVVTYNVLGLHMDEKFKVTGHQRPNSIENEVDGPMAGTFRWAFQPEGPSATLASVEVDYQLRGPSGIARAVDALLLERMNQRNMERMLENLQMILEGKPAGTG
jgi:carbon monoxide dehydrogenase subunit G